MNIEKINDAKEKAGKAWSLIVALNTFLTHLRTGIHPSGQKTYNYMKAMGVGEFSLKCGHPDQYGNDWAPSSVKIFASDLFKILNENPELRDQFFEKYKELLHSRHEAAMRVVKETKAEALRVIENA